jgi:tripartite-type tricarboxylate transporter receptor subunit TctC
LVTMLGGVSGARRIGLAWAAAIDVPSLADARLSGMVIYTWFGFLGPAKMPKAIVNKLRAEVVRAIAAPVVNERLQEVELIGSSSAAPVI